MKRKSNPFDLIEETFRGPGDKSYQHLRTENSI